MDLIHKCQSLINIKYVAYSVFRLNIQGIYVTYKQFDLMDQYLLVE